MNARRWFLVLVAFACFAAIAIRALWPVMLQSMHERQRREDTKKNLDQMSDAMRRYGERQSREDGTEPQPAIQSDRP